MSKYFWNGLLLIFIYTTISAQQNINLQECENIFIKNNLLLLAEQYNITIAKASVVQAKIWDLPIVSGELNVYYPDKDKILNIGNEGQKSFAIQQLIYLGKKKKKEIEFAKSNVVLAELQFEQLLRNLRLQIHQSFYTLYFEQEKKNSISAVITHLDSLIKKYAIQTSKGNIPMKDLVRLQSLALSIKSDMVSTQKNINEEQKNLQLLTNNNEYINPIISTNFLNDYYDKAIDISQDSLFTIALEKNPDYLSFLKILENNELLLRWQKSIAIPDITLGANYDQRGGAFNNQINLTFSIPLPLWNKNKGNIKIAESQIVQTKLQQEFKKIELKNKIENSYSIWKKQHDQYFEIIPNINNFLIVYQNVLKNFQKGNISILDFTDFVESYNQSAIQINEIKKQLILSCEELNHLTNQNIFNLL